MSSFISTFVSTRIVYITIISIIFAVAASICTDYLAATTPFLNNWYEEETNFEASSMTQRGATSLYYKLPFSGYF